MSFFFRGGEGKIETRNQILKGQIGERDRGTERPWGGLRHRETPRDWGAERPWEGLRYWETSRGLEVPQDLEHIFKNHFKSWTSPDQEPWSVALPTDIGYFHTPTWYIYQSWVLILFTLFLLFCIHNGHRLPNLNASSHRQFWGWFLLIMFVWLLILVDYLRWQYSVGHQSSSPTVNANINLHWLPSFVNLALVREQLNHYYISPTEYHQLPICNLLTLSPISTNLYSPLAQDQPTMNGEVLKHTCGPKWCFCVGPLGGVIAMDMPPEGHRLRWG